MFKGFHHITMNCNDVHENVAFYTNMLGLSLVKQTVNFDDPLTYHVYYGDDNGSPGTLLTFFPFEGIPKGKHGNNEIRKLAFAITPESIEFWMNRLTENNIEFTQIERFSQKIITFCDMDGLELELIATSNPPLLQKPTKLKENAIIGLYGITLHVHSSEKLVTLINYLGFRHTQSEHNYSRFVDSHTLQFVDVYISHEKSYSFGYGTVHHLAFHVDDAKQIQAQHDLLEKGYNITPVIDRQYFHSIYFRTFEGLLFEIATTSPGMFVDEDQLGSTLQIPPQHQKITEKIRKKLKPLH